MPLLATRPSPAALLRALKESNPSIPVSGKFLKVKEISKKGNKFKKATLLRKNKCSFLCVTHDDVIEKMACDS